MAEYLLLDVAIAYVIDLIAGDPYWLPHPVRFIGWLIKHTEVCLRKRIEKTVKGAVERRKAERRAGMALMLIVVASTFLIVLAIQELAAMLHPAAFHIVNIYFIYSALAAECLADEARKVYKVLKTGDMDESRKRLSMLVGRETKNLNRQEITRGVVETTAENTVDGVISPLIYAIAGSLFGVGAPVVYAFKAISTLDSMVGYMNDKYINLGMFSARTDDAANYLPARFSGILIPASALICGMSFSKSFSIMIRDRRNHKSPNCAYPEAAVAGALGIRIGGTNIYFGKAVEKPTIGDAERDISIEDIPRTILLMYVSSALTLIIGLISAMVIKKIIF
ncbi:MAG: adenosylcobinamide-phosphate synthase CbiB [Clostridia bacterium]|nr:adenosylcobinamide-phosphate synthase CbiB [Clostridia bacterium]